MQRRGARLLGEIASADAVPLLQPLLRQSDPRVARAAVAALGGIDDPAAARAVQTVLRAATGDSPARGHRRARRRQRSARGADAGPHHRGERAARQGPRGRDRDARRARHGRQRRGGPDRWSRCAQRKKFFGGKKLRRSKSMVSTRWRRSGPPKATAALDEAAATGDGMLKSAGRRRRSETDGSAGRPRSSSGGWPRRCAAPSSTRRRTRWCSAASTRSPAGAPSVCRRAVDRHRLHRRRSRRRRRRGCRSGTASLIGFARDLREREIEKITFARGVDARRGPRPSSRCLTDRAIAGPAARSTERERRARTSRSASIVVDEVGDEQAGIAAARRVYGTAVETAETLWNAAKAGDKPDPGRGAQDHRRPGAAGDAGPHVADGADRAQEVRQLHVHAHGERLGAGDGAGARAQHRRSAAARVRLRGADARHRQGQHAARSAEQAGQADQGRVRRS